MTDKKDTDPQSLRATADRLSALGVQIAELQGQFAEQALDLHDARVCYATLCVDHEALQRQVKVLETVVSSAVAKINGVKKPTRITKKELALILLGVVGLLVAISLFYPK